MIHEQITKMILGAFYEVYNTMGYGFLERVYQNAMYKELRRRGLRCDAQKEIEVYYKNEVVGVYYADILVEDMIIIELKAVEELHNAHELQITNYLKATNKEIGLLLNFGPKAVFKRKIFTNDKKTALKEIILEDEDED